MSPGWRIVLAGVPILAAILISVSSRRVWLERAGIGLTGADVTGGLITATALMLVITVAFLLVVKTTGRRITGILQALVGVGIVAIVVTHRTATAHQWAAKGVDARAPQVHVSGWPWVCLIAGAVTIVSGIALAALADRWPHQSARRRGEFSGDSRSTWDALDRGEDPTVSDAAVPPETAGHDIAASRSDISQQKPSTSSATGPSHNDVDNGQHVHTDDTSG
ncbi:Trp biosynthesis-associated membrane protein [Cutibacterium sp. WCA-380-WT-3A]|uniref:Trp biosynthesis-associated membrane protein n=1 Tax=Cutibacterium porci TaxID=2605781 RepID=A0A7K0J6D5_9ACTN|nr:Trp biosynthesis-associated membrane protein [Cutibacterium porci]